jgi:single-stranded DNA-specific DHH superfamily exonuclease
MAKSLISDKEWEKLRMEYVSSNITIRELAEKYGHSEDAIEKRAGRESWTDARRKLSAEVLAKADAELAEKRAKELIEFNEQDLKIAKAIRAQIAKHINDAMATGIPLSSSELRRLASSAESAQKIGRLALGVSTSNNEHTGVNGQPLVPVLDVHFVD